MTAPVDLRVMINGTPVRLCPDVATMILALIDNQETIHKQGVGSVALDYHGTDVTFSLRKLNYRIKARRLT